MKNIGLLPKMADCFLYFTSLYQAVQLSPHPKVIIKHICLHSTAGAACVGRKRYCLTLMISGHKGNERGFTTMVGPFD